MKKQLLGCWACAALSLGPLAVAQDQAPDHTCTARTPQAEQRMLERFAMLLLTNKQPRQAYERYASSALVERSKAFGTNRETTIAQWETMTKLPASHFDILSIRVQGDVGTIQFHGSLRPGQSGAQVTLYLRLRCGLITEEWDHFTVANPPGTPAAGAAASHAP